MPQRMELHYAGACRGYKKWLGRKALSWMEPPQGTWTHGELTVKVRPELMLGINGCPHLIKLYFTAPRSPRLGRQRPSN